VRPTDITAEVVGRDNSRNHAICSPRRLFKHRVTGVATTPNYHTMYVNVQQSVLLFRKTAAAAAAFKRVSRPDVARCFADYVHREAAIRAGTSIGSVTRQALIVEPVGEQSISYRLSVPIPQNEAAVDVLFNRIGRALSGVALVWRVPSQDLELQEALVVHLATRVRQALTARG